MVQEFPFAALEAHLPPACQRHARRATGMPAHLAMAGRSPGTGGQVFVKGLRLRSSLRNLRRPVAVAQLVTVTVNRQTFRAAQPNNDKRIVRRGEQRNR